MDFKHKFEKIFQKQFLFFANGKLLWHLFSLIEAHNSMAQKILRFLSNSYLTLIPYQVILYWHVAIPMDKIN